MKKNLFIKNMFQIIEILPNYQNQSEVTSNQNVMTANETSANVKFTEIYLSIFSKMSIF